MLNLPKRYQPTGNFASGGFGDVIFCDDQHLGRRVAIKFIKDASENHRMLDELKALMLLRSKNVVQLYDIVLSDKDSIGIVQEYIDGKDLLNSPFPNASRENYIKTLWQIASGIADIHDANVIHRDIKPNNMKFDNEGIVKIFDFGLSRDEGSKAVTQGYKGTPLFSAPELFNIGEVRFTTAIDVYAFGVTAIVLSGGKLFPFQPLPTNFFATLPIALPDELVSLLTKCLDPDPANRPSMAVIRDRLCRYLLHDKHQALAVYNKQPKVLNSSTRVVSLKLPEIGEIKIEYDEVDFCVTFVDGEVFINNSSVKQGDTIPGSCVVTLGNKERGPNRKYITFDVSHPEVVL